MKLLLSLIFVTCATLPGLLASAQDSDPSNKSMPITFVKISPGTFVMGSPESEYGHLRDEAQHSVTLTHAYEMQTTPITQMQWYTYAKDIPEMDPMPSFFSLPSNCPGGNININGNSMCPNHPVEKISWEDAVSFANEYSRQKSLKPCYVSQESHSYKIDKSIYDCEGYRLPTEAEWEYAARAGTTNTYFFGNNPNFLTHFAVFSESNPGLNGLSETADVGSLDVSPWGLSDIYGNVLQLVSDAYEAFEKTPMVDPTGPNLGDTIRVGRGGSFVLVASELRSASRITIYQRVRAVGTGLRLVRTVKP